MLQATKVSFWADAFWITDDDRHVATWHLATWRRGGRIDLTGWPYQVRSVGQDSCEMASVDGALVAVAEGVGQNSWTVAADDQVFGFSRETAWREVLHADGGPIGYITPAPGKAAVAELPGMSVRAQVFALSVVVSVWEQRLSQRDTGPPGRRTPGQPQATFPAFVAHRGGSGGI